MQAHNFFLTDLVQDILFLGCVGSGPLPSQSCKLSVQEVVCEVHHEAEDEDIQCLKK